MNKQKVWVEKMPEKCRDCIVFNKVNGLCSPQNLYMGETIKPKDCPLHSIKEHDRELARQVCEKIGKHAFDTLYKEGEFDIFNMDSILEDMKCEFRFSWRNKQDTKWQKLKEWVSFTQPKNINDEFIDGVCSAYSNVIDKMQELEAEDE